MLLQCLCEMRIILNKVSVSARPDALLIRTHSRTSLEQKSRSSLTFFRGCHFIIFVNQMCAASKCHNRRQRHLRPGAGAASAGFLRQAGRGERSPVRESRSYNPGEKTPEAPRRRRAQRAVLTPRRRLVPSIVRPLRLLQRL